MMLARTPWATALSLRRELDDLFNQVLDGGDWFGLRRPSSYPAVNMWEEPEALWAEAELPGVNMQDIEVVVVGNDLTIKGRRPEPTEKSATFHRRERGVGEFSRTLTLPVEIDLNKVEATLKDGVLTLKLPRAESARPRTITVRSS